MCLRCPGSSGVLILALYYYHDLIVRVSLSLCLLASFRDLRRHHVCPKCPGQIHIVVQKNLGVNFMPLFFLEKCHFLRQNCLNLSKKTTILGFRTQKSFLINFSTWEKKVATNRDLETHQAEACAGWLSNQ